MRWRENLLTKPDFTAFSFSNSTETITNSEVAKFASALSLFLGSQGYPRTQIVGVLHDQSPEAYLTQAALFLLGFPFVNIDPDSPGNRLLRVKQKLGLEIVFCSDVIAPNLSHFNAQPFLKRRAIVAIPVPDWNIVSAAESDLAYVVLTSGSTGEPKAVQITHNNIDHFVEWAEEAFALTPADVFSTLNPPYFDNAVFDFFCSQVLGARLHVIPSQLVQDPSRVSSALLESPSNVWFSVPSLMNYLIATRSLNHQVLNNFDKFLLGGEGLPKKLLESLMAMVDGSSCRIWNVYGPSECACMCSAFELTCETLETFDGLAPIGAISGKFRFHLKDSDTRGIGELVLEGPQVSPGYLGDELATERSFVQNKEQLGEVAFQGYLTGDLMRTDSAGRLRFVGRTDSQVKLMGRRIELTEIELEILLIDGCYEAFVTLAEGASSVAKLVAYVGGVAAQQEIRDTLASTLPRYMVPREVHVIPALPRNRNGKIDRKVLKEKLGNE